MAALTRLLLVWNTGVLWAAASAVQPEIERIIDVMVGKITWDDVTPMETDMKVPMSDIHESEPHEHGWHECSRSQVTEICEEGMGKVSLNYLPNLFAKHYEADEQSTEEGKSTQFVEDQTMWLQPLREQWWTITGSSQEGSPPLVQYVIKPLIQQNEQRVIELLFKQILVGWAKKSQRIGVKIRYDPAAKPWLQGHCLFACLTWSLWGKDLHSHIMALRHIAAEGLQEDQQLLQAAGLTEKLEPDEYIQKFTLGGWGGTPEMATIARKYAITIRVWNQDLKLLYVTANGDQCIDLLYDAEHYRVLSLQRKFSCKSAYVTSTSLRGGAGDEPRAEVILKSRRECQQERRDRREKALQQPPDKQAPLPPLDRPKRKLESVKEEKKVKATRSSGSNRPVSPVLKPKKSQRDASQVKDNAEPKTQNSEDKKPILDHEANEIVVSGERFCCLCGKWSDPPHRASIAHRKRVAYVEEMDPETKTEYMQSAKSWAEKTARQRLRGGAKSDEETATKTEQTVQENENKASSSSSTQQETSLATLVDMHDAEDEILVCDLAHLSLIDQVQEGMGVSSEAQEDFGDEGHDEHLRADHESDYGRESITESFDSDISFLDKPPEEARCMKIIIGRRLLLAITCQHTSTIELIARLAIIARLPTDSIALLRGNEMVTAHSQIALHLPLNGASWKLWKLPLSRERRQGHIDTESREPDDYLDERCDRCKEAETGCEVGTEQPEDLAPPLSETDETELMTAEDANVVLIKLKRSRDTILWSAYRGVTAGDVLRHYAAVKRVRRSGLIAYEAMESFRQFNADTEVLLQTGQPPLRGGDGVLSPRECIFKVTDHVKNTEYDLFVPETVEDLRQCITGKDIAFMCQGMLLPDSLYLTQLQWRGIQILPTSSSRWPWMSASLYQLLQGPCSLGDFCQWMMPHRRDVQISEQLWQVWLQDMVEHCTRAPDQALRGGGPGRPAWESTATLKGVKVINQIKVEGKVVPPITLDMLCDQTTGVACCLMSSWSRISQLQSAEPLLIIFPGKCMATLRRLGAAEKKVSEGELFMNNGDESSIFKRKVTFYKISEHNFEIGANIRNVQWQPAAQTEMLIELDGRWATTSTSERAKSDWKTVALAACKAATMTTVQQSEIYGVRRVDTMPFDLWQARVRLHMEASEKLLGASGKDAIFFRPAIPSQLQSASQFTIVWAKKSTEANSTALAATLQMLSQIAGHRGLARSISALGARVPWTAIREARSLFTPEDKRFVPETLAIKDSSKYKLDGVPAGATAPELARYLREVEWAAIPQRRLPGKSNAIWLVSAEAAPKDYCLRWGESNILVSAIADDDKLLQRQADKTQKKPYRKFSETGTGSDEPAEAQKEDELHAKDPWAKWMHASRSSPTSSASTREQKATARGVSSAQIFDMTSDSRLAVLANRMDKMESDHTKLATEVKAMDGKIGNLQVDMAQQFQQVLQGLASIQEMQAEGAKKHKAAGS